MSDYVFVRKSRNALSSILHILFNFALGVSSIALTIITGSPLLGILLVILSKWRIFAVRPRYWFLNIKSNLVDLIVGLSFVFIAYSAGTALLPVHVILAVLYVLWLIVLKPQSSERAAEWQALTAIFFGTTANMLIFSNAEAIFPVLISFIIGYGAARHIIVQSDDHDFTLITLTCGLIFAEITWICQSWSIIYSLNATSTGIVIPQASIILTVFAFAFTRLYHSISKNDGRLKRSEIALPTIFSIIIIAMVVIWFSVPTFNV